jgi:hypothetical protein
VVSHTPDGLSHLLIQEEPVALLRGNAICLRMADEDEKRRSSSSFCSFSGSRIEHQHVLMFFDESDIGLSRVLRRLGSDGAPWTLPAPWTRRRAHRALPNAQTRFAQRPQAITGGHFYFRKERGHFYFALTNPHFFLDIILALP